MEGQAGNRWETLEVRGADAAGVARLILNLPSQANALNGTIFREIPLAIAELDSDPGVRVIILGASGKHFCAGIDLKTLAATTVGNGGEDGKRNFGVERDHFRRVVKMMQNAFTAFEKCRKPVIASVFGACIGAGIDLITACDLRYCTEDAKFSVKEVDIAITADLGTLQRLPSIVGFAQAMELALTARAFDGKEAGRLGLVHGVFPSREELDRKVNEIATQMAEKSPLAIMGTKEVLLKSRDLSVSDGLDYVATFNAGMLWEDDMKESMTAKLEGRKPVFAKL